MSNILLTLIREQLPEVRGSSRAVLIALADRADDSGKCWPSLATIGRDAGISVATVKRALRRLRDAGWISWTHTTDAAGDLGSNLYHLCLRGRVTTAPPQPTVSQPVGSLRAKGRSTMSYKASLKHQKEAFLRPTALDSSNRKTPEPILTTSETIPVNLDTTPFRECWHQWKTHRRESRKPVRATQANAQLEKLAAMGAERATAAIRFSIAQGYQGIFEDRDQRGRHGLSSPVSRELRADQVGI